MYLGLVHWTYMAAQTCLNELDQSGFRPIESLKKRAKVVMGMNGNKRRYTTCLPLCNTWWLQLDPNDQNLMDKASLFGSYSKYKSIGVSHLEQENQRRSVLHWGKKNR